MILMDSSLEGFVENVRKTGWKIVVYGFGVIGKVTVPAFLAANHLEDRLLFYVDGDARKQGQYVPVGNRQVKVYGPERLGEAGEGLVLLISGSRYGGILDFLNGIECLKSVFGYIFPWMLVEAARTITQENRISKSEQPMIPKVIHYCWFGHGRVPDEMEVCMESWRKFCPDYEILEWNEDNFNIERYSYSSQAYRHGKWAFVSDIARLDILYKYGGIYLDTDVELIRSLDDLLYQPAFCGVEKWRLLNTGGGCGAVPQHPALKKMLDYRKDILFEYSDGRLNLESSGSYESCPLLEDGFVPDNTIQIVDGMTIYSSDFFHPFDYMSGETSITENTHGIHHFRGSWV